MPTRSKADGLLFNMPLSDPDTVTREKEEAVLRRFHEIQPIPAVVAIASRYRGTGRLAIASGGARLLTGASPERSCYGGPQPELALREIATGRLIDALPPGPVVADAALRTLAYGSQLWCAR